MDTKDGADEAGNAKDKKPLLADLKDGLRYIMRHAFLKRFFRIQITFQILLAPVALLTPLQVARNFGPAVWRLSAIEITFAAGMAAGGLLITLWGGFKNRIHTVALCFLLIGAMGAGLGLTKTFFLYCVFMAVAGLTSAGANTPVMTLLQEKVGQAYMGRIFSVITMISSIVLPVGMVIFGPLSDRISLDIIIIVTALLTAALGLYLFTDKVMLAAGRPTENQPE